MSKKIKIGQKSKMQLLSQSLEFPAGTLGSGAHFKIFSNKNAVIDGCAGVIEYTPELIKLNIGKGTVSFFGNDLKISFYGDTQLSLCGEILNIEFCI